MKEDLTLADSFALAEKHALWDEARRAEKGARAASKRIGGGSKKGRWKAAQQEQTEAKRRDRPMTKEGSTTRNYSKFSIPIHQILRDVKNEPWFKLPNIPSAFVHSPRTKSHHRKLLHLEELSGKAREGRQSRQVFGQASSAAKNEC